jgi:hypothetical protein
VDPHCFDADPDPAQNLDADPDPDPGGGGPGVGQPKMCIPLGKILGTPLSVDILSSEGLASYCLIHITILIFVKNKKKIKESESQSR